MSAPRVMVAGAHLGAVEHMEACMERALKSEGCDVLMFDYRESSLAPNFFKRLIPSSFRHRFSPLRFPAVEKADARKSSGRCVEAARRFRPDLFVAFRADRISPSAVAEISSLGALTVNWMGDDPSKFVPPEIVPAYDIWAIYDGGWVEWLRRHGARRIEHLPFGCDPTLHHPVELSPEERQQWSSRLCFIGSYSPRREEALSTIADLGLAIWGPRWHEARNPAIRACIRGIDPLRREQWLKAYAGADLVVNMHEQGKEGLNMRVWESLASGACLVCDHMGDLDALLPGVVAVYENPGQLHDLCRSLLENPGRRRELAQAGRKLVLERHTFANRVRVLLEWTRQSRAEKS